MMIDKIKSTILKHNMIAEGSTVVAAVSGGSDSMALLTALNSIKEELGINLHAAHVNHCLRGEAADRDELFVVSKCSEIGVPVSVLKVDVAAEAKKNGEGLEECGRRIRYKFFDSFGDDVVIATAHNLSDRAETFLFNFARGSTLRGLCSIPAVRNNIVRPLIDCSKKEILDFCEKNSVEYVTDETNADVKYSRNRIRHNVVTELCRINPSFENAACRCISSLNEDEQFLNSLAKDVTEKARKDCGFNASVINAAPAPIKKRAIIMISEEFANVTPEQRFVEKICEMLSAGGKIQINDGVTVRVRKGILDFPKDSVDIASVELCDSAEFGDTLIQTEIVNISETNNLQNFSKQVLEYLLDYDKIHGRIFVRSRESGDKISLRSRGCTKSLKKLFNELSIPPEKRNCIAVFADDCGVILVEGAGIDSRVAVTKETKKVLVIRLFKEY